MSKSDPEPANALYMYRGIIYNMATQMPISLNNNSPFGETNRIKNMYPGYIVIYYNRDVNEIGVLFL